MRDHCTDEALCEVAARQVNWSDAAPSISASTLSDRFRLQERLHAEDAEFSSDARLFAPSKGRY